MLTANTYNKLWQFPSLCPGKARYRSLTVMDMIEFDFEIRQNKDSNVTIASTALLIARSQNESFNCLQGHAYLQLCRQFCQPRHTWHRPASWTSFPRIESESEHHIQIQE